MAGPPRRQTGTLVAGTALIGAAVAVVLGFLTFGAQTTAQPEDLPVAVAAPESGPLRMAADRVSGLGGDAVDWRVTTPEEGSRLLEEQEVYGVLELGAQRGAPSATVVVSGAVNPSGTQVAQQVLTAAGQGVVGALAQQNPGLTPAPVRVETVHETGAAGRSAPLGISALAWVGGLAGCAVLALLVHRGTVRPGVGARLGHLVLTSVLVGGVLIGFLALWDSTLDLGWRTVGFVWLTVAAFAAVQGALLRLLGIRAMAILGPLYLLAPSVAAQVPELLDPAYRTLLWSWTPFRFSTEGLRSLLLGTPETMHVTTGLWVLGGLLAAGLAGVLWPGRSGSAREETEPQAPDGVVDVGVDEADRLPGAQGEGSAEHGNARVRR